MDECIDKLILFAFGILLLTGSTGKMEPVIAMLAAVTAAALGIYIEESRFLYPVYAILFLAAVWQPMLILFFPICLYDMVYRKMYAAAVPFLLLFAFYFPSPGKAALWILTVVLAVVLAYKREKKQYLSGELIRIRDTGEECNLLLIEKNKNLLEKQDYEIYLATLRERNRIAREIHDNVGHLLSRALLMTGALLTIEKEEAARSQLLLMKDTLDSAMDSIRQSVHDLHDDSIDLEQALREAAEAIRPEFEVKLEYDMSNDVPRRVKYCMIATAKEAVSNILKHSNGHFVQMSFREHPAFYQIMIADDGTNAKAEPYKGIGLQNMKERADSLGGTFGVRTQNGFAVFLMIPKTEDNLCGQ